MSIRLHIERLIVDGVPLTPAQARSLPAKVEARLGELLRAAPPEARASHAVDAVTTMPIAWGSGAASPAHAIAMSLHAALAPSPARPTNAPKAHV